jgi:hypothetical protein
MEYRIPKLFAPAIQDSNFGQENREQESVNQEAKIGDLFPGGVYFILTALLGVGGSTGGAIG